MYVGIFEGAARETQALPGMQRNADRSGRATWMLARAMPVRG